ncbi:MAG TPA: calcium-binding protein [Tepidisphaeraceae bacterium]|jgi:Ca2+-binding RTX toxin-like protein
MLESRTLFAAFAHIDANKVLVVDGTEAADKISLTYSGLSVTVSLNGKSQVFDRDLMQDNSDLTQVRINGYAGNDRIIADFNTPLNIAVYAGAGNDVVSTGRGRDFVSGGDGNDTINGGFYNDVLYGDAGADLIQGSDGRDLIKGGGGNDILAGNGGNDVVYGNGGRDVLTGGSGDDSLYGGIGIGDTLIGQTGNDYAAYDPGDRYLDKIEQLVK